MKDEDLKDIPTGVFVFMAICNSMPWIFLTAVICCAIIKG